jgi:CelD/BcsL family acetyltransferase involved in cellulose biosynthesis
VSAPRLGVRVVHELGDLAALADSWDALGETTPLTSAFESWAWIYTYAELLLPGTSRLRVFVVEDQGEAAAIFPMSIERHGTARFLGSGVGSYSGPTYDPSVLEPAVDVWGKTLSAWPDVRAVDLNGLRGGTPFTEIVVRDLAGWGRPSLAETDVCVEVELGAGAETLTGGRSPKTRSSLKRRWRRLEEQGRLEVSELVSPEDVVESLPRLFELFEARWAGQHPSGGFVSDLQPFHRLAARRLAERGAVDLFALRLDGTIISYVFGLRAGGITTSYVTAYDTEYSRFSPGLLVHWRLLEELADRGDATFDLSLGEFGYKSEWATAERAVYRMHWGRARRVRCARDRLRVRARSVPLLRDLKLRGPAALYGWARRLARRGS